MTPPRRITIDPNRLRSRDVLLVRLILGANKADIAVDRRKEAARRACRGRVRGDDDR